MGESLTPFGVMLNTLKDLSVSNKEACSILLTRRHSFGGMTPAEHAEADRTWVSRELKQSEPGRYPLTFFADFPQAAQGLCARVVGGRKALTHDELADYLCGAPAIDMQQALRTFHKDDVLFANLMGKAASDKARTPADRATLAMLAFIATGALGEPAQAVDIVQDFSKRVAAKSLTTEVADESAYRPDGGQRPRGKKMGLVRVVDGTLDFSAVFELSAEESGTVVGQLATGPADICDVGPLVSGRHARLYRDGGKWLIQGLGSTNGTTLVRGSDKSELTVEEPKGRHRGKPAPVPFDVGDTLCFGGDTAFIAVLM